MVDIFASEVCESGPTRSSASWAKIDTALCGISPTFFYGGGEGFYCRYKRESCRRHLEESRVGRERSRLNMARRLTGPWEERGRESEKTKTREGQENQEPRERNWAQLNDGMSLVFGLEFLYLPRNRKRKWMKTDASSGEDWSAFNDAFFLKIIQPMPADVYCDAILGGSK